MSTVYLAPKYLPVRIVLIIFNFFVFISMISAQENNYLYDEQGRIIADHSEGIVEIAWNCKNKITNIVRADTSHRPDIEFYYDVAGHRVAKLIKPRNGSSLLPQSAWEYVYYNRDGQGNVISAYNRVYKTVGPNDFYDELVHVENALYSGRHNYTSPSPMVSAHFTANDGSEFSNVEWQGVLVFPVQEEKITIRGEKEYEFANHLRSVSAVTSDRVVNDQAEVIFAIDYYPFGMKMSERTYQLDRYEYGYVGMLSDGEIKGDHNAYDFGARILDPRLARWLSLDAKGGNHPDLTYYQYSANSPVQFYDPDGNDYEWIPGKSWINEKNLTPKIFEAYQEITKIARTLLEITGPTAKILDELKNNHNVKVYIVFTDKTVAKTKDDPHLLGWTQLLYEGGHFGPIQKGYLEATEDGKVVVSNEFYNSSLRGHDVTKDVNTAKKVYIIHASIVERDANGNARMRDPAQIANTIAHEIESHVNIPNNESNSWFYRGFSGLYTKEEVDHHLYGVDPETSAGQIARNGMLYFSGYYIGSTAWKAAYSLYNTQQTMRDLLRRGMPLEQAIEFYQQMEPQMLQRMHLFEKRIKEQQNMNEAGNDEKGKK